MLKEVRDGCSFCGVAYKDGDVVAFALAGTYHIECPSDKPGTRAKRMRGIKKANGRSAHSMIAVFAWTLDTARTVVANHVEQEHSK